MATISDLQKGLVGHWTMNFEDVDNGIVRDRSAYDNHGTLNGNPTTGNDAPVREAFGFDGNGDYINVGDKFDNLESLTFATWLKTSTFPSTSRVMGKEDAILWGVTDRSTGQTIEYFTTSDSNNFVSSYYPGENIPSGEWVHIGITWDGSDLRFYIDGQLSSGSPISTSISEMGSSSDNFTIGARQSGSQPFTGDLSEVRVYNRALSQSEIQTLYRQRSKRTAKFETAGELYKVDASGGTTSTNDSGYKIHEFTSDGTFTVNSKGVIDFLIVAGGGGGGGRHGAGGGAGGVVYESNYSITPGSYSVTVGSGGSGGPGSGGPGTQGGNSVFKGFTALGGGGGDSYDGAANVDGGSGGGQASGSGSSSPGTGLQPSSGTEGFGNDGGNTGGGNNYNHGGGGGALEVGIDGVGTNGGSPGAGGDGIYFGGLFSDSFGENGFFAGGGGGGSHDPRPDNFNNEGGKGGGGHGGEEPYDTNTDSGGTGDDGEPGMVNTGGGGGGGSTNSSSGGGGGNGGSGIVLIRYKN